MVSGSDKAARRPRGGPSRRRVKSRAPPPRRLSRRRIGDPVDEAEDHDRLRCNSRATASRKAPRASTGTMAAAAMTSRRQSSDKASAISENRYSDLREMQGRWPPACDGHHKMSDWGAVDEPVHRGGRALSQCALRVDDGMVRPIGRFSHKEKLLWRNLRYPT